MLAIKTKMVKRLLSNLTNININQSKAKIYAREVNLFDLFALLKKVEQPKDKTLCVSQRT